MNNDTHIKTVKGKTVLVPSLALLQQFLPSQSGPVDTAMMRKALTEAHSTTLVCPVTMRRHFKTLGLAVKAKTG
jgi:hypothetical protein